jgi:hypothetical protein
MIDLGVVSSSQVATETVKKLLHINKLLCDD